MGRDNDGGYVMVNHELGGGVCYSLGISDDVSWDSSMAARGYEVFMYDNTITALPEAHAQFHFFQTGICGHQNHQNGYVTLDEAIVANDHGLVLT